jgi:phosphoribosylformylglycinamidine synthase
MKAGIVVFPGSNCDYDCYYALNDLLNISSRFLWHKDSHLYDVDLVILPGGFSYGDYLRCGMIATLSPIMRSITSFAERGGLVLGICNGFQILVESALLPGAFLRNRDLKFICDYVYLRVESTLTPFTKNLDGKILSIPIAHKDGNYYVDKETLAEMYKNGQVIFKYCDSNGYINGFANPNGSTDNIAGVSNKAGNILGMMPHPERASEKTLASVDGSYIFNSIKSLLA